nr:hypothetical protein [Bradyrhizobium japonicum]
MKNAMRKHGTANRTHGLLKAIRLGLIEFSESALATPLVASTGTTSAAYAATNIIW